MLNEEELDTKETSVENNNSETKKKDLGEKHGTLLVPIPEEKNKSLNLLKDVVLI